MHRNGVFISKQENEDLMHRCWAKDVKDNPRRWIQGFFPWGQAGTTLHNQKEPKAFQIEILEYITDAIHQNKCLIALGLEPKIIRISVASGRGIGKSALLEGMLPMWMLCTQLGAPIIMTANNDDQLRTKTWAELSVWFDLCYLNHWFLKTAEAITPTDVFAYTVANDLKKSLQYYYLRGQLWNRENPGGFAGAHSPHGLMVIFAEAAGIFHKVWTVARGFFSDPTPYRFFIASGNPRDNTSYFFQTQHKHRHQWRYWRIDSRTVPGVDVAEANSIIEEFGEGSPEACAEVTGQFPEYSEKQLFSRRLVVDAAMRPLISRDPGAPVIVGVDVARQGEDASVIQARQGRDARTWPAESYHVPDNAFIARKVVEYCERIKEATGRWPDAINVDVGQGGGVIDILRSWGHTVNEVDFGSSATNPKRFKNKRAEMAWDSKLWMATGCIANDEKLIDDLCGPEYGYSGDSSALVVESKDSMKERGLASPDRADALWLTHAVPVARRDLIIAGPPHATTGPIIAVGADKEPYGW